MSTVVTSSPSHDTQPTVDAAAALRQIEQRVLWLSTAMIHHANRVRPNPTGLKVGGHQASCASMVSIMTSLWFEQLGPRDRVSVKPHASPVLHAINYLLGELDESYLTTLREFGGLQSYPSRSKDPDPVDYSTGSVGIGATAPIWGAIARRYVDTQFGGAGTGRQYSLVGDAELDEGAVWEAILDPSVAELGEIVWIVDLNRQSLDRVVPNIAAGRLESMFAAAGWQVITVKFGALLESLFARPGGPELRTRILDMPNPEYQRLLRCTAERAAGAAARRGRRRRRDRVADRRTRRRHADPRDPQPGRSRPGHPARRVRADRRHPADDHHRLHASRVTACRRRGIRRITRRC